jgi:hypothetical protein
MKLQKPIEGKIHHSYICNKTSKTNRRQNSPFIRLQQNFKNQSKAKFTIHTFAIKLQKRIEGEIHVCTAGHS